MNDTEENIREQMRMALATYTGPITKCPAGKPRGKAVKFAKPNRPNRWLNLHRNDVAEKDTKAESRRLRMARAQRERTATRNAAIKRRIGTGAP
jgi:hypothetical protein